jgi:hypothetical protein
LRKISILALSGQLSVIRLNHGLSQLSAALALVSPDRGKYFGRKGVDFTVSRNGSETLTRGIAVHAVFTAITNQDAAMRL